TVEGNVPKLSLGAAKHPDFALAVEIFSDDERIGFAGQLSADKSSAPGSVFIAEVNADRFLDRGASAKKFRELDRYTSITRDIAMIIPEKLTNAEILRAIQEPSEQLRESVELIDLSNTKEVADTIGCGKSLAYR